MERTINRLKMNGWLALSPLAVFLVTYLASSLVAHDFYKVPIASAFLIASVTFVICVAGGFIGKKVGTRLSGRAGILGGVILIGIGLEIFLTSLF